MKISSFTPAQTLMITAPLGVSGKNLLKYSFLDLVFKGVLQVYTEWRLSHPRDPRERRYTLVSRGKNYNSYSSTIHQQPFVQPFEEYDCEFQVRSLLKRVYEKCERSTGFKFNYVYPELKKHGYFHSSFGLKNLNIFFLNSAGKRLKSQFKDQLSQAEQLLSRYAEEENSKAIEVVNQLGSNLLLLENFNAELMESLRPMLAHFDQNFHDKGGLDSVIDPMDSFEFMFWSFLSNMDTMDMSFDYFKSTIDFSSEKLADVFEEGGGDMRDLRTYDRPID